LDFNGSFAMDGGLLIAAGSSGMAQAPGTSSSQASVLLGFGSTAAGTLVHIQSQDGVGILDFVPNRTFAALAFSAADLEEGETYDVFTGGTATGTLTDGLYQGGIYTPGTYVGDSTVSGN
jgi:hypothetical protein